MLVLCTITYCTVVQLHIVLHVQLHIRTIHVQHMYVICITILHIRMYNYIYVL